MRSNRKRASPTPIFAGKSIRLTAIAQVLDELDPLGAVLARAACSGGPVAAIGRGRGRRDTDGRSGQQAPTSRADHSDVDGRGSRRHGRLCYPVRPSPDIDRQQRDTRIKLAPRVCGRPCPGEFAWPSRKGMRVTTRAQTWIRPATILGLLLPLCGAGVLIHGPQRALAQTEPGTQVNVELMMDSSGSMGGGHRHRRTADRRRQARAQPGDRRDPGRPAGDQRRLPGLRTQGQQHARRAGRRAASRPDLTVPVQGVDKDGAARAGRQLRAGRVDADRALAASARGRLPGRIGHRDQRDHPGHRRSRDLRRRPVRASPPR